MVIYKVHQVRVVTAFVFLAFLLILLCLLLNSDSPGCVRVSVSVQQQWPPHVVLLQAPPVEKKSSEVKKQPLVEDPDPLRKPFVGAVRYESVLLQRLSEGDPNNQRQSVALESYKMGRRKEPFVGSVQYNNVAGPFLTVDKQNPDLLESEDSSRTKKEPLIGGDRYNSAWFRTRILLPQSSSSWKKSEKEHFGVDEEEDAEHSEGEREDDGKEDYGYNEDEYDYENNVFEDGDFDYSSNSTGGNLLQQTDLGIIMRMLMSDNSSRPRATMSASRPQAEWMKSSVFEDSLVLPKNTTIHRKYLRRKLRNITLINVEGIPIVEDGVFWSDELERRAPKGASDDEAEEVLKKLRSLKAQRVEPPTWNRCGRPKNQFVVFEDGSKACARYRAPHQYLVQGEVLSFYLSRLLGIYNVPVVSMAAVEPDFRGTWSREAVRQDLLASGWEANTTVALIHWIEDLERDRMPPLLLASLESEDKPLSAKSSSLVTLSAKKLTELLQWTDLIVFDYITGNYDRVASMQDAVEKEGRPSILRETVHNLVRSRRDGGLWLIDNESGLLDSYSLLYGKGDGRKFAQFHRKVLRSTCLFRRSTVERVRLLHDTGRAGRILMELVGRLEPLFTPVAGEKDVSARLQQRIDEVYQHMERCHQ